MDHRVNPIGPVAGVTVAAIVDYQEQISYAFDRRIDRDAMTFCVWGDDWRRI